MRSTLRFSSPLLKRYILILGGSVTLVSILTLYFGARLERIYSISRRSEELESKIVRISRLEQQYFLKKLNVPFVVNDEKTTLDERSKLLDEARKITQELLSRFRDEHRHKVTHLIDTFERHVQAFDLIVSEYDRLLDPEFLSHVHQDARGFESDLEKRGDDRALLEFLRLQRADQIAMQWDMKTPFDRSRYLKSLSQRASKIPQLKDDLKKYEENFQEYQKRYNTLGFTRENGVRKQVYTTAVEMHQALAEVDHIRYKSNEHLHRDLFIGLVLFLSMVIGQGIFFLKITARSFAKPVDDLAQYIIRLGRGELSTIPPDFRTSEEFQFLVQNLTDMAKSLQCTMVSRQELFKSQALLETILLGVQDGIVTVDFDGNLVYLNRSAAELLEIADSKPLIGQPFVPTLHEKYLYFDENGVPIPREEMPISSTLRGGTHLPKVCQVRAKDGNRPERWVTVQAISLCDEQQKLCYIVAVIKDITEQKKAETMMEQQRAQLAHSAKLSSIGVMAAGIAHEINNPLSVIQRRAEQISETLAEPQPDLTQIKSYAEKIVAFSQRIAKIIRSLKYLSRNGENDPIEKVPLKALIDDCIELSHEKFKNQGVELKVDLPPFDLEMECRPSQILQVLVNLLNNALDAVQTQGASNPKWVRVEVAKAQSHPGASTILIRVCDSGPGVPTELREKVGIPFFTTKEAGKGTGLGLSVSTRLIESHFGTLKLDLKSPFTAFEIRLPEVQPKPEARAA